LKNNFYPLAAQVALFLFAFRVINTRAAIGSATQLGGRKKAMKKQAFGIFTMLGLLLVLGVASVSAQSKRTLNIPFSFSVGHKTLPAGEYIVAPRRSDSQNVWLLTTRDGSAKVVFTTGSARDSQTAEKVKLVFHKYDTQYFLAQVWTPGNNSGRELRMPLAERRLEKNGIQREPVDVTISGTN